VCAYTPTPTLKTQHSAPPDTLKLNPNPQPRPQFKMDEQLPGHTEYLMAFEEARGRSQGSMLRYESRDLDRANGLVNLPWQVRARALGAHCGAAEFC